MPSPFVVSRRLTPPLGRLESPDTPRRSVVKPRRSGERSGEAANPDNHTRKRRLLRTFARDAAMLSHVHGSSAMRWKRIDDASDAILVLLAALTVSSIFLNYVNSSGTVQLASAVLGSIATVGQTVKKGIGVTRRWMNKQTLANKYADLSREVVIRLTQTNITAEALTALLNDVDERIALMAPGEPVSIPGGASSPLTLARGLTAPPNSKHTPPNKQKHSTTPSPIDVLITSEE